METPTKALKPKRYCRECGSAVGTLPNGDMQLCCEIGKDREEFYGDASLLVAGANGANYAAPVGPLPFADLPQDTQEAIEVLNAMEGVADWWHFMCCLPWLTPRICKAVANDLAFRNEVFQGDDGVKRRRIMLTENARDALNAYCGNV